MSEIRLTVWRRNEIRSQRTEAHDWKYDVNARDFTNFLGRPDCWTVTRTMDAVYPGGGGTSDLDTMALQSRGPMPKTRLGTGPQELSLSRILYLWTLCSCTCAKILFSYSLSRVGKSLSPQKWSQFPKNYQSIKSAEEDDRQVLPDFSGNRFFSVKFTEILILMITFNFSLMIILNFNLIQILFLI